MAKYERLSPLDRTFLDLEYPETHMHVASVAVFDAGPLRTPDGGIDIEKIQKYVASRLHLIPRYRQRIAESGLALTRHRDRHSDLERQLLEEEAKDQIEPPHA